MKRKLCHNLIKCDEKIQLKFIYLFVYCSLKHIISRIIYVMQIFEVNEEKKKHTLDIKILFTVL